MRSKELGMSKSGGNCQSPSPGSMNAAGIEGQSPCLHTAETSFIEPAGTRMEEPGGVETLPRKPEFDRPSKV